MDIRVSPVRSVGKAGFPYESFVVQSVRIYLEGLGFLIGEDRVIDIIASKTEGSSTINWHIEAKGKTTAVGLDFRTGVGQLVQRIGSRSTFHGLAIPDIPEFRKQTSQFQPWVISVLNLHWIWVAPDGSVVVDRPPLDQSLTAFELSKEPCL